MSNKGGETIGHNPGEGNRQTEFQEIFETKVLSRIDEMCFVPYENTRKIVWDVWHRAETLAKKEKPRWEEIQVVLNDITANDEVPLLGKVAGIISICKASTKVASMDRKTLWENIQMTIESDPDEENVNFAILTGAWMAGLYFASPDEYRKVRQGILTGLQHTPLNKHGVLVAEEKLLSIIPHNDLSPRLLRAILSDTEEHEQKERRPSSGVPLTTMVLNPGRLPSREKMREAVEKGIPLPDGRRRLGVLHAMIGVETRQIVKDPESSLITDEKRNWTYVLIPSTERVRTGTEDRKESFALGSLHLWVAIRTVKDMRGVGINRGNIDKIIDSRMGYHMNLLEKKVPALHNGEVVQLPGIFGRAQEEYQAQMGSRKARQFANPLGEFRKSVSLLIKESGRFDGNDFIVPRRDQVWDVFLRQVLMSIPEEDFLAFSTISFPRNADLARGLTEEETRIFRSCLEHNAPLSPNLRRRLVDLFVQQEEVSIEDDGNGHGKTRNKNTITMRFLTIKDNPAQPGDVMIVRSDKDEEEPVW